MYDSAASTDGEIAHVTQSDDDGVLSSASSQVGRDSPPPEERQQERTVAAIKKLSTIVDADVPYATALYSTDGVVIKYVIRVLDQDGTRWSVEKRYSDILALHETLRDAYQSTRSIGTRLSSLIGGGTRGSSNSRATTTSTGVGASSTRQSGTTAAAAGSREASVASSSSSPPSSSQPAATAHDDNHHSSLSFPKFPGKALSKSTNCSIRFILGRRKELSHYFSAIVRNRCRSFLRTEAAQMALCDFLKIPNSPAASLQSTYGGGGGSTSTMATESMYYFRENEDGFLTVEQKCYVFAYFAVPASYYECSNREWRTLAATKPIDSKNVTNIDDRIAVSTVAVHGSAQHVPSSGQKARTAGGTRSHHADPTWLTAPSLSREERKFSLTRNGCIDALIPTLTISLPYARIMHDLFDSKRLMVALRCDRMEGRAEVQRRRDELLAFYRHIANGSVDRLPDVHEAKRFFVNYRRDNPLKDYGTMLLCVPNASYRDSLPGNNSITSRKLNIAKKKKAAARENDMRASDGDDENQHNNPLEELSDVEDNLDRDRDTEDDDNDDDDDSDDAKESIVISLASLRSGTLARLTNNNTSGSNANLLLGEVISAADGGGGGRSNSVSSLTVGRAAASLSLPPGDVAAASTSLRGSFADSTVDAGGAAAGGSTAAANNNNNSMTSNSVSEHWKHYIRVSFREGVGLSTSTSTSSGSRESRIRSITRPVPGCTCTSSTFCQQSDATSCIEDCLSRTEIHGYQAATTSATSATSAASSRVMSYQCANSFQINIHCPTVGEHKKPRRGSSSPASSRSCSRM